MDRSPAETDGSSSVSLPVFTGMVFGDDTGEAYVRSLAMFMEGIVDDKEVSQMSESDAAGLLQVKEHIRKKVEKLTRGASTIADKVAAIVLEEKTGQPSDVDTRVLKALWQQDFDTDMGDATEATVITALVDEKVGENKDVFQDDNKGMQIDQLMEPEDVVMEGAIVTSKGGEAEATAAATTTDVELKDAEVKSEGRDDLRQQQRPAKDEKDVEKLDVCMTSSQAEPEMIDIRQVVHDIKAWPQVQKVKADYESWRQLKIELNSLLPLAPADEKVRIEWGKSWTGGDSDESRKWVRESLEMNSTDMRKMVELIAAKTADQATKVTTDASAEEAATEDKGKAVNDKDVEAVTLSDEDKALMQRLTKSIRERLAEMTKYIPLSEINPQKLPPPIVPTAPSPAPTPALITPTLSAAASATPTPAPATPIVTTPVTVASVTAPPAPPALAATASLAAPASGSAVPTPVTSQAIPVAPVAPVVPTAGTTPTAIAARASVSTAPTLSALSTAFTSTTAAMEAPKPSPSSAPKLVSVPTSVAVPGLTSPAATEAKPTGGSTVPVTVISEPNLVAPLSASTTTETSTSQPLTTSSAPIVEPTDAAIAASELVALPEPKAAVADSTAAAPSDKEGSASSLSSPGSSP